MGRRSVVAISSLNVINPNYTAVKSAIDVLQGAETDFYGDRKDELNTYPGLGGLSRSQVESDYDALLGAEPWKYTSIFNSSGNSRRSATGGIFGGTTTIDVLVPSALYARIEATLGSPFTGGSGEIEYVLGEGEPEVDILYTDISFFKTGYFTEVPRAYESNSLYSGRKAHMYRLIGSLYDQSVGSAYNSYIGTLNSYRDWEGAGTDDFITGTGSTPWAGYTGDPNSGYNRPSRLSSKLIRETRGAN